MEKVESTVLLLVHRDINSTVKNSSVRTLIKGNISFFFDVGQLRVDLQRLRWEQGGYEAASAFGNTRVATKTYPQAQ